MPSPAVKRILLSSVFDPDAASYFSAIQNNGGSINSSAQHAVNQFIRGLKTDGVWDLIFDMGLFSGVDNFNAAMVKIKTPPGVNRVLVNSNFVSADYTALGASAGLKGNGTNKELATGTSSSLMSLGSGSLGIYGSSFETTGFKGFLSALQTPPTPLTAHYFIGQDGTPRAGCIGPAIASDGIFISSPAPAAAAFEIMTRIATNDSRFFRNGIQIGNNTSTVSTLFSANFLVFAKIVGLCSAMRGNFYFIGLGLSPSQVMSLSTRVNNLMTTFGSPVY